MDSPFGQPLLSATKTAKGTTLASLRSAVRRHTGKPGAARPVTRLLIISRNAGSVTPEVEARLRAEFADYLIIDFDPKEDFEKLITPRATVVVAGGDGSIEFVVRKLADTKHPLGILSLGTYNNFAHALGLPSDLKEMIRVAKEGSPRAIKLGRVNGCVFVEACAIGLFGETIALGESAKDLEFGKIGPKLKNVLTAPRFKYELTGDINGSGTAMSLVFSNTSSFGSQLPVSGANPIEPYLEFSVHAGRTRTDIVGRAVASAVLQKHAEEDGQAFKFKRLEVTTHPKVRVYADNYVVGRTPATITAELSALKVLLPK
jgi:diacylglycerol kinase family enzyme